MSAIYVHQYMKAGFDSPEFKKAIEDIANEINTQQRSIVSLVESAEPLLTNTDPFERAKGICLLSKVLKECNSNVISQQSATVLVEFFLSRLDDQPSVADILDGLLVLLDMNVVSKTEQMNIPSKIFVELNVQNFAQSVRNNVFSIFSKLLQDNVAGLKKLGSEFIMGFIHSMDGEKDPRNLLLLFQLTKQIMTYLDYKPHAQDLFEVNFCYFPITFRPPPDDPFGVTAEDLKASLREIICFSPQFAPLAIPVLVEKLASSSSSAKKDAIDTIIDCLPVYGIQPFIPSIKEIWEDLKKDVASATNDASELNALKCLRELTKYAATSVLSSKDFKSPLDIVLGIIIPDCLRNLKEPELKYARPCGKILMSCSSSNETACSSIINDVFKPVLDQYYKEETHSKKRVLLGVLVDLMLASRLVSGTKTINNADDLDVESPNPISVYKNDCLEILTMILGTSNYIPLRSTAVLGIFELLGTSGLLNHDEVSLLMDHLTSCAIANEDIEVQSEVSKALEGLSQTQPFTILRHVLPKVFAVTESSNIEKLESLVGIISIMTIEDSLFTEITPKLFQQLNRYQLSKDYTAGIIVLKGILKYFTKKISQKQLIASQIQLAYSILDSQDLYDYIVADQDLLSAFGKILCLIVRSIDEEAQASLIEALLRKNNEITRIPSTEAMSLLYQCIMCNLKPKTNHGLSDLNQYLINSVRKAIELKSELYLESTGAILGSFINKISQDEVILSLINLFEETFLQKAITDRTLNDWARLSTIYITGWIAKGLLLKGHSSGQSLLNKIIHCLADNTLAVACTEAIEIVVKKSQYDILTKQSFAIQKILYEQRFYNQTIPILIKLFHSLEEKKRKYPLLAISHILCNLKNKNMISDFENLFPMLLFSLRIADAKLKKTTLDTFELMIYQKPSIFADNISTIIDTLLSLLKHGDGNDVHVRTSSLRLLGMVSKQVEFSILSPFKPLVIKSLGLTLDDHKKVVRREAANTRCKWSLLIGPKES